MVVRISKGQFDAAQAGEVRGLLRESEATLAPALRALAGLRSYWVGLDPAANAMTNVSVWETRDHALQMASLREMRDLRVRFEALGVRFEEITNHEVLWDVR
jgi:hypothetical protein